MLKAGFGRIDITPPLGSYLQGYQDPRYAKGVLDPLSANSIAFDDGDKRAVIIVCDLVGISQEVMETLRPTVAEIAGIPREAVFVSCTHIHTGPGLSKYRHGFNNEKYVEWLMKRLGDAAVLALNDLAEAKMSYTRGHVEDIAFIRRFRMKNGDVQTNPGWQNPDIDHPLGTPDEESQLLIIKREGKPEIGIVNFQVHPDVIGGEYISADYPGFVRRTYEKNIPNSLCIYINGAWGDTNHIDVRLSGKEDYAMGYKRAKHMGEKIAFSVLSNYELAKPLPDGAVNFAEKRIDIKYRKAGSAEELEKAKALVELQQRVGVDAALPGVEPQMKRVELVAEAQRIVGLANVTKDKELVLTAISAGGVAFAGFPGEPFAEVGRAIKSKTKFELTIPVGGANGYEAYYPTKEAFSEGGYEVAGARLVEGTAEKLVETSAEMINKF